MGTTIVPKNQQLISEKQPMLIFKKMDKLFLKTDTELKLLKRIYFYESYDFLERYRDAKFESLTKSSHQSSTKWSQEFQFNDHKKTHMKKILKLYVKNSININTIFQCEKILLEVVGI